MSPQFRFTKQADESHDILVRKRQWEPIGKIRPIKESNGRHSFYLACDIRVESRIYRSMKLAAEALLVIHDLVSAARNVETREEKPTPRR